jgi:hypothetical protein
MRELWEFTKLIRSKNAGPFELTFDMMFKDQESFSHVLQSGVLSKEKISELYQVNIAEIRFFEIPRLHTIKITIPRKIFSGDVQDTDIYGGQFHGPLIKLRVP